MLKIPKPQPGEYALYATMYIDLIPDDRDVLAHLKESLTGAKEIVLAYPPDKLSVPCKDGEWTIKEILSHIMDTERVFAYRALRFARNDPTELFPVDQDLYVRKSGINKRDIQDILEEYTSIRQATLTFFNSLQEEVLTRAGLVKGNRTTVRALAWLTAGHEQHHLGSIAQNYSLN